MKKWLIILLLFPFSCIAQIYKYIGVEDGLSNRRVYSIQKDRKGYMWFLTHEGIDRYNGKEFKQYKLMDGKEEVNSLLNLNWLYIDTEGVLWEIGKKGKVYRYDKAHDTFELVYKLPVVENKDMPAPVSYSYIDNSHTIWLCCEKSIYLYDTKSQDTTEIANAIDETITDIAQIDETHFFIGTEKGIHYAELKQGTLSLIHCDKLDKIAVQINELYFDQKTKKLFIGTFQRGIYVYDMNTKQSFQPQITLTDISINAIKPLNNKELLIATDGAGVFEMNIDSYQANPYIVADYNKNNATRFIILAKDPVYQKEANKISICFECAHKSGTLYNMLGNLIYNNVNMLMIESRPIPGKSWEYRFFVDVEGNLSDPAVQNALKGIAEEAATLRILGNYEA